MHGIATPGNGIITAFGPGRDLTLRATVKNYLPAIACALTPLLCYIAIRAHAEIGINDDWCYLKTAQVLAQTGHLTYNGWGGAMLGWHAYLAVLLVKLFGFSFTVVRITTVIEAMAIAFLLQRTCLRAGVNSWNATLATTTFVLSPLCLPPDFTFMDDLPGALCVVVCLYMCLRAEQAKSERSTIAWISLAALVNALGGTARQIAWLGVLVMVPCTLWLLRRNRRALVIGCLSCIAASGFMMATMHWQAGQSYVITDSLIPRGINLESLRELGRVGVRAAGQLMLLALPVLLMFVGILRPWNRRVATVFAAGLLCFAVTAIALFRARALGIWLAPFMGDYMTDSAFEKLNAIVAQGVHLAIARKSLSLLLTGAVVLGLLGLLTCLCAGAFERPTAPQATTSISWQNLAMIVGPFSASYVVVLALLQLRYGGLFDRYLLPLLPILLLLLTRCYQQRVKANLPVWCGLLIVFFGAFSVVATHDDFALYRGYVTAINKIRSAGVPATAILGPWEFEAWTELGKVGYVNNSMIRVPEGAYVPQPERSIPDNCGTLSPHEAWSVIFLKEAPAIKPVYGIFLNPEECGGKLAFPPVAYRTWIGPHFNSIYILKLPSPFLQ